MKKNALLKKNIEELSFAITVKETEIAELKSHVSKLEELIPISKLKKLSTDKIVEADPPVETKTLFDVQKIEDGSSF